MSLFRYIDKINQNFFPATEGWKLINRFSQHNQLRFMVFEREFPDKVERGMIGFSAGKTTGKQQISQFNKLLSLLSSPEAPLQQKVLVAEVPVASDLLPEDMEFMHFNPGNIHTLLKGRKAVLR